MAGAGELIKPIINGALYAGAIKLSGMIPGLAANFKRYITIAVLWFLGPAARSVAKIGIAFEAFGITNSFLNGISLPGLMQAQSSVAGP